MTVPPIAGATSVWPRRFALITFWLTLLLVVVGSQVTTTGAGMAVKGWIMAEGSDGTYHFMPFFPFAEYFRNHATMWEHTHRLIGILVGLASIATVVAAKRTGLRAGAFTGAIVTLIAIVLQGVIGGMRVELNMPALALLHGVTGQATLALIAGTVLMCSRRWQGTVAAPPVPISGPRDIAVATTIAILGQVALGAWHRHGYRNPEFDEFAGALHIHMTGAFLVLGLVTFLAVRVSLFVNKLTEAGASDDAVAPLVAGKKRMHALIGVQILLGFVAWMAQGDRDTISLMEQVVSALHLLVAALLVCQSFVLVLWIVRLAVGDPREGGSTAGAATGEGA